MTMHDQRAIAFSTMHDARTVQRCNRASGMLESTIRVRCVFLCCSTACRTGERTILRIQYWMPWSMTVTSLSPWQTFLSLDSTGQNRVFLSRAMPSPNWSHLRHTGPQPRGTNRSIHPSKRPSVGRGAGGGRAGARGRYTRHGGFTEDLCARGRYTRQDGGRTGLCTNGHAS
jgi:hypothetical protein